MTTEQDADSMMDIWHEHYNTLINEEYNNY